MKEHIVEFCRLSWWSCWGVYNELPSRTTYQWTDSNAI